MMILAKKFHSLKKALYVFPIRGISPNLVTLVAGTSPILTLRRFTDRMTRDRCYDFLNIFAEKFSEKKAFFTQNKAKLCKILIITLVFEKNANFFRRKLPKIAENCRKSQKIVIITSTPGANPKTSGMLFVAS
jgi:hypothetical protein